MNSLYICSKIQMILINNPTESQLKRRRWYFVPMIIDPAVAQNIA